MLIAQIQLGLSDCATTLAGAVRDTPAAGQHKIEGQTMSIATDNLIHFLGRSQKNSPTNQLDIFKSIIEQGIRTGKITIKFGDGATISKQIACFTDIPLGDCDDHTAIYGKFGIGFRKSFVKRLGGNPARYFVDYLPGETNNEMQVENRGQLYLHLCRNFKMLLKLQSFKFQNGNFDIFDSTGSLILDSGEIQEFISNLIHIYSYDKEIGDIGPARDETREMDLYYREREWRIVPSQYTIYSGEAIQVGEQFYFPFDSQDVNMILVPNQDCRSAVMSFFSSLQQSEDERLKSFSSNSIPVICYDDLRRW